ncbi:ferredoxin--NADP reductase [Hymenobacter sp. GOD-10R]|uniref:ferredoxin--NADP reductase n=1 Tax=Hymenobacter sp. GOD-10R TaxID=3093922 RepID=UPI002D7A1307|nr:ferredoxin--NADP reductase [Hymenobacter sp. GOD-10R]WRQ27826.1 ferredoxin--NADP reductase [Hymenobacter sp. GOD-10R]
MIKSVIVSAIRQETPEVKTLLLDAPALSYQAGQYLTFVHPRNEELRRSYSISSAPVLDESLAVTVKRVPNGLFSRYLADTVQVGDTLLTIGAGGFFTLPETLDDEYQQVFFFAAGSGITPIYALLKSVLHQHPSLHAVLIYSNRTPADAVFYPELQHLASQFADRLKVEFLFSNHPVLARARLYRDLLETFVKQYSLTTPERTLAFLCGPLNYMRMCVYGLREIGIPLANIRRENFNPETAHPTFATPPDTEPHNVTVQLTGTTHTFETQYPVSILQTAKKQGIALPYSCGNGVCGSCVARCTSGQVWMATNEVLTERDLAKGLVLTCTGYPVGGDVRLEL